MFSRNSKEQIQELAILLSDNGRARAYLSELNKANLIPAKAIVIEKAEVTKVPSELNASDYFDNQTPIKNLLKSMSIPFEVFKVDSIYNETLINQVHLIEQKMIIFAGPAGSILSARYFQSDKQLIHVHPGKLPQFRGSTPMYYSLLAEDNITMSAFIMQATLDAGEVIYEHRFENVVNRDKIDKELDPYYRALVLVKALLHYEKQGAFKRYDVSESERKGEEVGEKFYVIHPLLKHVAILSEKKN